MTTKTKKAGVITLEIELEKSLSHGRRLAVDLAWDDMTQLPLASDELYIDDIKISLVSGPADNDTILDKPGSLKDYTWKGIHRGIEWMSIQTFAKMIDKDPAARNPRMI